jgi:hypothetical protein
MAWTRRDHSVVILADMKNRFQCLKIVNECVIMKAAQERANLIEGQTVILALEDKKYATEN